LSKTDFAAMSRLSADIDLFAEGKATGFVRVPHSVHRSAYGWIPIPIVRIKNGQIGIHRNNNRTIEFFGQYSILRQGGGTPVDVSALATIEGTNNFRDSYSPALGAIISRTVRA